MNGVSKMAFLTKTKYVIPLLITSNDWIGNRKPKYKGNKGANFKPFVVKNAKYGLNEGLVQSFCIFELLCYP